MPPKRNQQRIEEVYDRNNLNREIGPLIDQRMVAVVEQLTVGIDQLLDRHMDRILPFERTDSVDLQVIVSRAVTSYLRRSPIGVSSSRAGRGAREEESGFRPSRYGEATGSIMPVAGVQQRVFHERGWRGGHGSEQGRQHDVTVQTLVHEFDDSGSKATPRKRLRAVVVVAEAEGSKEDGFRKKEKKLKGDKEFDKGGKMSSKGGSLSAIYLAAIAR
ncbi:hypothetical protein Syun_019773 [Stephania yunnanensis]|uniref:Uncharacterized protein n=1 Tax=Stephania yunnanensis TaxID=152371 RepID=A0AAP0NZQ9_9MAGN